MEDIFWRTQVPVLLEKSVPDSILVGRETFSEEPRLLWHCILSFLQHIFLFTPHVGRHGWNLYVAVGLVVFRLNYVMEGSRKNRIGNWRAQNATSLHFEENKKLLLCTFMYLKVFLLGFGDFTVFLVVVLPSKWNKYNCLKHKTIYRSNMKIREHVKKYCTLSGRLLGGINKLANR